MIPLVGTQDGDEMSDSTPAAPSAIEQAKTEVCSELVGYPGSFQAYPCEKRATKHEDGRDYCTIHAPSYMKAKREARALKEAERTKRAGETLMRARELCEKLAVGKPQIQRLEDGYTYRIVLELAEAESLLAAAHGRGQGETRIEYRIVADESMPLEDDIQEKNEQRPLGNGTPRVSLSSLD